MYIYTQLYLCLSMYIHGDFRQQQDHARDHVLLHLLTGVGHTETRSGHTKMQSFVSRWTPHAITSFSTQPGTGVGHTQTRLVTGVGHTLTRSVHTETRSGHTNVQRFVRSLTPYAITSSLTYPGTGVGHTRTRLVLTETHSGHTQLDHKYDHVLLDLLRGLEVESVQGYLAHLLLGPYSR